MVISVATPVISLKMAFAVSKTLWRKIALCKKCLREALRRCNVIKRNKTKNKNKTKEAEEEEEETIFCNQEMRINVSFLQSLLNSDILRTFETDRRRSLQRESRK